MNKRERKKKKMKMRMKRFKYCTHSSSSSSSVSSATDYTTSEEDNDGRQLRGSTSAGESGTGCVFIKAVSQLFEKGKKNPHVKNLNQILAFEVKERIEYVPQRLASHLRPVSAGGHIAFQR